MKKMILFAALLVALSATAAMAAGVSVSWGNKCWADGGVSSLTWACNSNTNTGIRMTCSFQPAEDKTNFVGVGIYMEGATNDPGTLCPDWWKLGTGECRAAAVSVSADASVLPGACMDPWTSAGGGGGGFGLYTDDTYRAHMNAFWAIADITPVLAADETFAIQFRVTAAKTVGTGLCAGCTTPFTWALNYIQVSYSDGPEEFLGTPIPGGNQCLRWQNGTALCDRPIPVRNSTWGQVKSLYR